MRNITTAQPPTVSMRIGVRFDDFATNQYAHRLPTLWAFTTHVTLH